MNRKVEHEARKSARDEATQSGADVPPLGAIDKKKIRSVDLEPRSNGENDWQDERRDPKGSQSTDGV